MMDTQRNDESHGAAVNEKAVHGIQEFLEALGLDIASLGMEKTPYRVAEAFQQFFSGLSKDAGSALGDLIDTDTKGIVVVRNIRFFSLCEHHLLPFFGTVHIAYFPRDGKIAGFSHFADVVDILARRPQLQERFTEHLCRVLTERLNAKGVLVIVKATQLCVTMRSPSGADSTILTSAASGCLQEGEKEHEKAWNLLMERNEPIHE